MTSLNIHRVSSIKASTKKGLTLGQGWLELEVETKTDGSFYIYLHYNEGDSLLKETVINGAKYVRIGRVSDE